MAFEIVFTEEVRDDIYNILDYIYTKFYLYNTALNLYLKIQNGGKSLSRNPEMFAKIGIKDRYGRDYRRMVLEKKYILLYTINYDEKMVYILHLYNRQAKLSKWINLNLIIQILSKSLKKIKIY